MIILIGGEKGGPGKTTIATNLAAMRTRKSNDLLLIDTDKQPTASYWCSLRENDMDMTGWLEYFTHALSEQMQEIKTKGEVVIRADVLGKRHNLSERQTKAVQHILQYGELTIKEFAELCSDTPRRSLQRDLKNLVDKGLLRTKGATNQLIYKLMP